MKLDQIESDYNITENEISELKIKLRDLNLSFAEKEKINVEIAKKNNKLKQLATEFNLRYKKR